MGEKTILESRAVIKYFLVFYFQQTAVVRSAGAYGINACSVKDVSVNVAFSSDFTAQLYVSSDPTANKLAVGLIFPWVVTCSNWMSCKKNTAIAI